MRFIAILAVLVLNLLVSSSALAKEYGTVQIRFNISFSEVEEYSIYNLENAVWLYSQRPGSSEAQALSPPGSDGLAQVSLLQGHYILRVLEHDLSFEVNPEDVTYLLVSSQGYPLHQYGADFDGDRIINEKDLCPVVPEDFNGYKDDDGCPDGIPVSFQSEVYYNVDLILQVYNLEATDYMNYYTKDGGKQLLLSHGTFLTSVAPGKYRLQAYRDDDPIQEASPNTFEVSEGDTITVEIQDAGFGPEIQLKIIGSESLVVEAESTPPKSPPQILDEINPLARPLRGAVSIGYHFAWAEVGEGLYPDDPLDYRSNQSGIWFGGGANFNRYRLRVELLGGYDSLMPDSPFFVGVQPTVGFDFTHFRAFWGWRFEWQGIGEQDYWFYHDGQVISLDVAPFQYKFKGEILPSIRFGGSYLFYGYGLQKVSGQRDYRTVAYPAWYIKFDL